MPWHPIFIHYPIALLTTAVLVDAASLLCRRETWHRVAYALLVAGTVGAAASVELRGCTIASCMGPGVKIDDTAVAQEFKN